MEISLNHLRSLDHVSPENCHSALAAASLLDAMASCSSITATRVEGEEVEEEEEEEEESGLDASQKTTLERIHSEISNFELEGEEEEFKRLLENLRETLVSLLAPK